MAQITLEQALFRRDGQESPVLVARSAGFDAAWVAEMPQLIVGFGVRRVGVRCPLTVFARPIGAKQVAIARVMEDGASGLRFHFLVVGQKAYETWIRDPFMLAEKFPPTWDTTGDLPTLTIEEGAFKPRSLAQVQEVLKRIKAAALKEGEDPEALDFERTMENSESPALLGGAQILVDGGRLVFERPEGDLRMVSGLWLLLPEMTRCRLWPTSFALSQDLEFDVLVLPRLDDVVLESYTTEEQAASYPDGTYESALQLAAESGTQQDLDIVFSRRDSHSTIRLAVLVLASQWFNFAPQRPTEPEEQAVVAAGIVAVADPWGALGGLMYGKTRWTGEEKKRDAK
ncbi:MAG: hypothetical protein HY289_06880 [Planctomycetes bacterium]|nr:hypothetical protein [Planctomycetota bacterium]